MTDMVIPPAAVEAAARGMFAEEQCDKRQRQDLEGNWNSRLNDEDHAEYRALATAALEAALPHLRPMLELAGNLGRELGRREALDEAAGLLDGMAAMWATPKDYPKDWDAQHLIVRNASQVATRNAAKAVREIATKEPK